MQVQWKTWAHRIGLQRRWCGAALRCILQFRSGVLGVILTATQYLGTAMSETFSSFVMANLDLPDGSRTGWLSGYDSPAGLTAR